MNERRSIIFAMAELAPGLTIRDKYQVVDKLGAGGMAVVYRVRHLAFGETFAIKVVNTLLADNEELLKRFKNEAIITRRLRHPNAVRVDDLDVTDDGRPFIVMEYVEGQSLRKVLQDQGALPVPRALAIARQVASALSAAHELGIVHRDIKPDNILLASAPDGTEVAKVLDFGIAKIREGTMPMGDGYTPTQTGIIVGTPQYISPEQALGMKGDDIDGRADIYSVGVVLYEMLTADLPFRSDTPMGMMMHHIQTPPTPPRTLRPDLAIPQTLSDVLMKALAKDPGRRFQTADELLQALSRPHDGAVTSMHRAPLAAAGPVNPDAPTEPRRTPPRPRSTAASMVAQHAAMASVPEPMDLGRSLPINRTMLTLGAVALVGIGLAVMWPSPPPTAKSTPAVVPTMPVPPDPPPPGVAPVATTDAAGGEGAVPPVPPGDVPVDVPPDDAQILAETSRRLTSSDALKEAQIEVAVESGVVTLKGSARATQREIAAALAGSVAGVKEVQNHIADKDAAPPLDPRVQELVQDGYAALGRGDNDTAITKFNAALDIDAQCGVARLGLERAKAPRRH
jgi:serine/threonine protein kinase